MTEQATIAAGAILASSWGYEQTNVDFFRVEKVKGAWATLQEIEHVETSDDERHGYTTMTGQVVPADPPRPKGATFRRKIGACCGEPFVKIRSYSYAYPWDGRPKRVSHYG